MYGDSKRAQRFYQQDSDAEEEEELLPNPKLAAGDYKQVIRFVFLNTIKINFQTRKQSSQKIWSLSSRVSQYATR